MTREEIEAKIDELESDKFYLAMKDHWSVSDSQRDTELFNQIQKLKKQLEGM